jgi:hypothetical protein
VEADFVVSLDSRFGVRAPILRIAARVRISPRLDLMPGLRFLQAERIMGNASVMSQMDQKATLGQRSSDVRFTPESGH